MIDMINKLVRFWYPQMNFFYFEWTICCHRSIAVKTCIRPAVFCMQSRSRWEGNNRQPLWKKSTTGHCQVATRRVHEISSEPFYMLQFCNSQPLANDPARFKAAFWSVEQFLQVRCQHRLPKSILSRIRVNPSSHTVALSPVCNLLPV